VDFNRTEKLPLTQGRFLGYGVHGGVYETNCNGIALAWKRKFCRTKIGKRELQEIEIIKRLRHQHIIRLVGTYTHGQFLGLLLWPVAVCDLADLMEDRDWLQSHFEGIEQELAQSPTGVILSDDGGEHASRLQALGLWATPLRTTRDSVLRHLEQSVGCIASAVAYLHRQGVKHKDLKPSNILLSANGLWLTDFGTASDFSLLTQSATEGGERGTPKYFAPEVAAYEPSGRSADIFSLGCIFFEVISLILGYTSASMKDLRQKKDKSFQANLDSIMEWFNCRRIQSRMAADTFFMGLVRRMLSAVPANRPMADSIEDEISLISGFVFLEWRAEGCYWGPCCTLDRTTEDLAQSMVSEFQKMQITIGNTYEFQLGPPRLRLYTFFLRPSFPAAVEQVHIFKVIAHPSCNCKLSGSQYVDSVLSIKVSPTLTRSSTSLLMNSKVWDGAAST
jgi:serine/threonine protein kinase